MAAGESNSTVIRIEKGVHNALKVISKNEERAMGRILKLAVRAYSEGKEYEAEVREILK